jgi:hypothetical protein
MQGLRTRGRITNFSPSIEKAAGATRGWLLSTFGALGTGARGGLGRQVAADSPVDSDAAGASGDGSGASVTSALLIRKSRIFSSRS